MTVCTIFVMDEKLPIIAFFRSCLRKTFRDQVIKSLRGLPGEHTHTTYRSQWLTPEVIDHFEKGGDFQALSILVDPGAELAIPSRLMRPVEPPRYDSTADSWNFTFELGNFVTFNRRSERRLSEWPESLSLTPPEKFVSRFNPDWVRVQELEYRKSKPAWKQAIDFVVENWASDFQESVFLRPSKSDEVVVMATGPTIRTRQLEETRITFDSYNPHLSDAQIARKRINVAISDVLGDVSVVPPLVSDGEFTVPMTFLEPGTARIVIDVQPDAHYSAYIPITAMVEADPRLDPMGPRMLGPAWKEFLEACAGDGNTKGTDATWLFDRLNLVFPSDPELMLQRGLLRFTDGRFEDALADFAKTLERRNDPRGVWFSLLSALHLDDKVRTHELLERATAIPSSDEGSAAFKAAILHLHALSNSTVEWFCEYPRAITSDDASLKMLEEMVKGSRNETALVAVLSEMGKLSPEASVRELDRLIAEHPEWREVRLLRARLLLVNEQFEMGEIDAELLFNYVGQSVSEYVDLIRQLTPLIHPQRLPALLYSNALRLHDKGDRERTRAAIEMAVTATRSAINIGNLAEAQRCLGFVEIRLFEHEGDNRQFRGQVNECVSDFMGILESSHFASASMDAEVEASLLTLKEKFEGKTLVVFGGRRDAEKERALRDCLGLKGLTWLAWDDGRAPDAARLLEHTEEGGTLVVISLDDGLIPSDVRMRLRNKNVFLVRAIDRVSGIVHSLDLLGGAHSEISGFVPGSCEEALEFAQLKCPNLEFSPRVSIRIGELDDNEFAELVRKRIVSDLELLNRYALDALAGRVGGGIKNWLELNGFNAKKHFASTESQTTSNSLRAREERTFTCSKGRVYMPEHFKLPGEYPTKARIYFTTDFAAKDGKVIVGYVGPHLHLD